MTKTITVLGLVVWIGIGVLNYGLNLAEFQERWPEFAYANRSKDISFAVMTLIGGPLALPAALSGCCRYGLRYIPLSAEESWQAYHKRYPNLTKEDWEGPRDR